MIDKKLLEILACPVCKGEVEEKEEKIICLKCGRKYPKAKFVLLITIDQNVL